MKATIRRAKQAPPPVEAVVLELSLEQAQELSGCLYPGRAVPPILFYLGVELRDVLEDIDPPHRLSRRASSLRARAAAEAAALLIAEDTQ